jgi:hypothetical protein
MIISKHDLECWLLEQDYIVDAKVKSEDNSVVVVGIVFEPPVNSDIAWQEMYMLDLRKRLDEVKVVGISIVLEIGVGKGPYR